ncbi:MAG: DUF4336 domain-containing protein [Maritimibacter sp.]
MKDSYGSLQLFAPGIWLVEYPINYSGITFNARTSIIQLSSGKLILHSPCEITPALKAEIEAIGPVGWLVAPGNFHHLHRTSAQEAFPEAETWIAPGVEKKQPELQFDGMLGAEMPAEWLGEIDQVFVPGSRVISEVVFLHRASRTLIVTDLIELIGPETQGVGWGIKFYWKFITFMWNKPRPAPEYSMLMRYKPTAAALRKVLAWEFDRIVLSHGDLIEENAHARAEEAWAKVLRKG